MSDLVPTRLVLHLNLNTKDIEAASRFYVDVFGLDLRMKSEGDDGDWRFHGLPDPVSSAGWFLYDDRGPRLAPAFELVEWRKPATAGSSYGSLIHRGLASVTLAVPTLDGIAQAVLGAGGQVVGDLDDQSQESPGLLIRDLDGAHVEVRTADLEATRVTRARIGVADLDASLSWYAVLGFDPTGEPREHEVLIDGKTARARSVRVQLASGTLQLELTQWLDPVAPEPPQAKLWHQGMVRMAVSVDDLDTSIAVLKARGLPCPEPSYFAIPGTSIGGLHVLFLNDPDGFTVELVHRPPRHLSSTAAGSGEATP